MACSTPDSYAHRAATATAVRPPTSYAPSLTPTIQAFYETAGETSRRWQHQASGICAIKKDAAHRGVLHLLHLIIYDNYS